MIEIHTPKDKLQRTSKLKPFITFLLVLLACIFATPSFSDHGEHELIDKALAEDSASAQYKLGLKYLTGKKDEPVDINKAINWLTLASEQGFAAASHRLAMLHFEGKHPALARQEAIGLLQQAADKGHAQAKIDLVSVTLNPPPLKKADKKIIEQAPTNKQIATDNKPTKKPPTIDKKNTKLVAQLAQSGNIEAQFILAGLLRNGEGVPKDAAAAAKWYQKAADQEHSEAMFELGDMYSTGDGIKRDRGKAKKLYKKAAEKGHTRARLRLSGCKDC